MYHVYMNDGQVFPIDTTSIAVINTNIAYIQRDIALINANIKDLANVYETKVNAEDTRKSLENRLTHLESANGLKSLTLPITTFIIGSIIVFLLVSYLQSFHR